MDNLTITKEKVLEAAAKCPQAKETLKTLFPEVFYESERDAKAISDFAHFINLDNKFPYSWYNAMPGTVHKEKARLFFENYIKPNLKK